MLPFIIIIGIILITIILFLFSRRFTIVRINGNSMLPTFKHGQIRVVDRKYLDVYFHEVIKNGMSVLTNKIFVIHTPKGVFAIKRLKYVSETTAGIYFWFEGDNADNSEDSRHYGFLQQDDIIGEVITFKQAIKRILKK